MNKHFFLSLLFNKGGCKRSTIHTHNKTHNKVIWLNLIKKNKRIGKKIHDGKWKTTTERKKRKKQDHESLVIFIYSHQQWHNHVIWDFLIENEYINRHYNNINKKKTGIWFWVWECDLIVYAANFEIGILFNAYILIY